MGGCQRDQNPDGQRDALAAATCDEVLVDRANGKLARRPALDQALLVARAGDQLVVTKFDRLGRSLEHLIALSKDLQDKGVDLVVLDQRSTRPPRWDGCSYRSWGRSPSSSMP